MHTNLRRTHPVATDWDYWITAADPWRQPKHNDQAVLIEAHAHRTVEKMKNHQKTI